MMSLLWQPKLRPFFLPIKLRPLKYYFLVGTLKYIFLVTEHWNIIDQRFCWAKHSSHSHIERNETCWNVMFDHKLTWLPIKFIFKSYLIYPLTTYTYGIKKISVHFATLCFVLDNTSRLIEIQTCVILTTDGA